MEIEEWRGIPGFEYYEASNLGRIRSLRRLQLRCHPKNKEVLYYQPYGGFTLTPSIESDKGKYPHNYVTLRKNGESIKFRVHRLVLMAFIGKCPSGMECCHNDGNGLNNNVENLRWDTPSNNQLDRYKHGTGWNPRYKGQEHPSSKLKDKDIIKMRSVERTKFTASKIAKEYNISKSSVFQILARKTWKHI